MNTNVNNNEEDSKTKSETLEYKLRGGGHAQFSISEKECKSFGFNYGERVRIPSGKNAWVIGVKDKNLYFHIDGEAGASYYEGYKQEDFEKQGFQLISPRLVQSNTFNKSADLEQIYHAPALGSLLESSTFSDITFELQNDNSTVSIHAHRNILVARSQYFRAMFTSGMRESQSLKTPISIPTVDPATFKMVLHFLYTGKIENINEDNVCALMSAASLFILDDLKQMLYAFITKVVSIQNVVDFFMIAEATSDAKLRKVVREFILANWEEFVKTDQLAKLVDFKEFVAELLKELTPINSKKKKKTV